MLLNLIHLSAVGLGHISHISRVMFVDAPFIFRAAWAAVSPLLPSSLTNVVTFLNTTHDGDVEWCAGVCKLLSLGGIEPGS